MLLVKTHGSLNEIFAAEARPESFGSDAELRAFVRRQTKSLKSPDGISDPEWLAVNTVIEESLAWEVIPRLKEANAQGIVEYPLNKVVV